MFNLEPIAEYQLERPPLVQALAQVRFPLVARAATLGGLAPLQEALSSLLPFVQRFQETSLTVDVSGEPDVKSELTNSWHFTDDEGRLLALNINSLTFSVGHQYVGVNDFLSRFQDILTIAKDHLLIRRCDRIGIRYLDAVSTDDADDNGGNWHDWFRPEILGWPASNVVAEESKIDSIVSQTQLHARPNGASDMPSDMMAVIRHGVFDKGSVVPGIPPVVLTSRSFVFDLDFFVTAQQAFDVREICREARVMHGYLDRFFRWSLTREGEEYFGIKEHQ